MSVGLLAAAASVMLLLGGCGGGGEPETGQVGAPAATASAETTDSEATADTNGGSTQSPGGDEDGGSGGGKPSLDEVKAGLPEWIQNSAGGGLLDQVPESMITKLTDCWAEKAYDELSDDSLRKLADGQDPTDLDDLNKLQEIFQSPECMEAAGA